MNRKGVTTTLQERFEIGEKSAAGLTDPEIATIMSLALSTVRKWRRRYQREGRAGLVSKMGRPAGGALSSYSLEIREAIHALRTVHPGWGPDTLIDALQQDPVWDNHILPGRTQLASFLKEGGLTRRYHKGLTILFPGILALRQ